MANDNELNQVLDTVAEADERELATVLFAAFSALGHLGRPGAEALLAKLKSDQSDDYVAEGIAQIMAVEGVLDGRTDAL